ncbi:hypothetical protein CLAVI_000508 [Candidatus Clavichlamydia salmonicola]|uniref:DUF5399 family protein n=1 Tax=Candidatus Clavichlamydia salmonicola TaxID=469812 RepID=UPI001890D9D1|nr:DUF5399 family protein [Candidatus Clavichlamydia salmonicola]MBF5050886.1 hypothetical protein [Candidatus Clavichlamydia salmonicola]
MVEIFNYSSSVQERFVQEQKALQGFQQKLSVQPHTFRQMALHASVLDVTPRSSALSSLMGTDQKISWAHFSPPTNFRSQRVRSPYLVPSLGSSEKQDQDMEKICSFLHTMTGGQFFYSSKVSLIGKQKSFDEESQEESENHDEDEDQDPMISQGKKILKVLDLGIKSSNVMIDYIISRMFQFVQG